MAKRGKPTDDLLFEFADLLEDIAVSASPSAETSEVSARPAPNFV